MPDPQPEEQNGGFPWESLEEWPRLPDGGGRGRPRIDLPVEEMAKLYEEVQSREKVGRKYGVSGMTALRRLHEAGAEVRKRQLRIDLPVEEMAKLYEEVQSSDKVGRKYGVSGDTALRRLHEAGAEVRPPGGRKKR